jgi:hypothetical protein
VLFARDEHSVFQRLKRLEQERIGFNALLDVVGTL